MGAGIVAWFKGSDPFNVRISPGSKVVVTYRDDAELDKALCVLRERGVPRSGSKVSLVFDSWNPPYDEMRYIYDRYEKGHLTHLPGCPACMMESMDRLVQVFSFTAPPLPMLNPTQALNFFPFTPYPASLFDPATFFSGWVKRWHEELSQSMSAYVNERILRASGVLEAMLPRESESRA